jgi:filamentous hemagglutinin
MAQVGSESFGAHVAIQGTDCSELAADLYRAGGGEGYIIRFDPAKPGGLTLYENGAFSPAGNNFYHEVFTDGRYVFDPRLSTTPVPKGDYMRFMQGLNKDATVTIYRP